MLKWLRNRLKWWIAGDELAEVERWRIRCHEYDRWLAAYPDIALVLQNLRAMAGGAGCTSSIAVNVPWIGPEDGPWDISGLRVMVARLRATPAGDWQQYAKEGETAQDVIERERGDNHALMRLLAQEREQAAAGVTEVPHG